MLAEIDFNDSDVKDLWDDLIENALEYASIRIKWLTFTKEERRDREKNLVRTAKHNTVISSLTFIFG